MCRFPARPLSGLGVLLQFFVLSLTSGCGAPHDPSPTVSDIAPPALAASNAGPPSDFTGYDWSAVGVAFKEPAPARADTDPKTAELAKSRREIRRFTGHTARITAVDFSPNDQYALSASEDGTVRWWHAETGKQLHLFDDVSSTPTCLAVALVEKTAIVGCRDGTIHILDLANGKLFKTLKEHRAAVTHLTFSPDGTWLLSSDEDGLVLLWLARAWQNLKIAASFAFEGQRYYPSFDTTGELVMLQATATQLSRWRTSDGGTHRPLWLQSPLPNARLLQLPQSPIVAANRRTLMFLRLIGSDTYKASEPYVSSLDRIFQIAPILGTGLIAAVGGGGAVEYWRPNLEEPAGRYPMPAEGVTAAAFRPRKLQSLSGYEDGSLVLWQLPPPRFSPHEQQTLEMHNLEALLYAEKFDALEKLADDYRQNPRERVTHEAELGVFYESLDVPPLPHRDWDHHFALIRRWRDAKPESITPRIVEAKALITHGWEARGSGYANTVSRQGLEVFEERLKKAIEVLAEASTLPTKDPELYRLVVAAHRGLGMPREAADEALRKGQEVDAYYFPLYNEMTGYLLPRWRGSPGDIARWSAEVCDALPQRGDEFYARIACTLFWFGNRDAHAEYGMDVARIRRGLAQMKPDYREDRWLLNCGALFACLAGDDAVAHQHFQRIGAVYEPRIWRDDVDYYQFTRWADPARARGQEKTTVFDSAGLLRSMVLTADGKFLATVSGDRRTPLKIWNVETGQIVHRLNISDAPLRDAVFHPLAPTLVITASGYLPRIPRESDSEEVLEKRAAAGGLAVWNLLRPDDEPQMLYEGGVQCLRISADSRLLAASCSDKKVRVWNLLASEPSMEFAHRQAADDLAFSPDNKQLATQIDGFIQLWDIAPDAKGRLVNKELAGGSSRRNLRFSPDGAVLTFGNMNGELLLWDLAKQEPRHLLSRKPAVNLYQVAFSRDGRLMATADDGYSIRIWDVATANELHEFKGHHTMLIAVEFLPDGKTVASAAYDGTVKLWDVAKWAR
jgi:WD40 repeat protein